jgi:F-box-like
MIHQHRSTEPLKKFGKETIVQIARVRLLCHGSDYNTPDQYNLDHLRVTINILPDDALLEIFDLYVNDEGALITQWHTLVHVCRRWREIVFASPHRLNLRLVYRGMKPSKTMDTWPDVPLTLAISKGLPEYYGSRIGQIWDNIVATLKSGYHDRVSAIYLHDIPKSHLETIAEVMQKPLQRLTNMSLSVLRDGDLVIPDSELFLGGSAPRLRTLALEKCSFPGMQKLLLSANGLVTLSLHDIPHSGYISPDAMVSALSLMTRLNILQLEFRSPLSRPDPERQLPPPIRTVLSTITSSFTFKGVREYSEDLMAQIDVPLLQHLSIVFFMDLIFDVPQLCRFISHIEGFKMFHRAEVTIDYENVLCTLSSQENTAGYLRHLDFGIRCRRVDWQLESLAHVCGTSLPPISAVEVLEIGSGALPLELRWKDDSDIMMEPESTQWLELLHPFTADQRSGVACE